MTPTATTVFRDKLSAGISFPVGREALAEHLGAEVVAVYFISTATWLRQAAPLDTPHLPVLRLQRRPARLRVRNERITPLPGGCSLHAIVYAVPSRLRKVVHDALLAAVRDWADAGRARIDDAGRLVVYFDAPNRLSVDRKLPDWV